MSLDIFNFLQKKQHVRINKIDDSLKIKFCSFYFLSHCLTWYSVQYGSGHPHYRMNLVINIFFSINTLYDLNIYCWTQCRRDPLDVGTWSVPERCVQSYKIYMLLHNQITKSPHDVKSRYTLVSVGSHLYYTLAVSQLIRIGTDVGDNCQRYLTHMLPFHNKVGLNFRIETLFLNSVILLPIA